MPTTQLLAHATIGGLSVLPALWVFVELLNVRENNIERIKIAAILALIFIWAAYLVGGWFYVFHYGADKAIIKAGHWPWAHNFFMEVKEHLFFIVLLLATYLPIVVRRNNLLLNKSARKLSMAVSAMIVIFALTMEGFGSIIAMGVKQGLLK
jgi:predicted membrane channel-forming protein YqfA (hemolysin III family)